MPSVIDMEGKVFGRWTVIRYDCKKNRFAYWLCRCKCGVEVSVSGAHLRSGNSQSCGCLSREMHSQRLTTHGANETPEYAAWLGMKARCNNPNGPAFKNYGGRGITVCPEWCSFERFFSDMGNRPSPDHSLDRIDNDKGYSPGNCRWATRAEQSLNKRTTLRLSHRGRQIALKSLANELGVDYFRLLDGLDRLVGHSRKVNTGGLLNGWRRRNGC